MNTREKGDTLARPAAQEAKWWQGTNFWVAAIMAVGSIWGLQESDVAPVVASVFGFVGAAFAIREKIKNTLIDWAAWAKSPNTWNYVVAAIAAVVPSIPAGLGEKFSDIIAAIAGKNWPSLVTAVLSFFTMIYFWLIAGRFAKK